LNKITSNIGNSFVLDYGGARIKTVISTAIDTLDSDNKLHIGVIFAYGTFICLAQKSVVDYYASGLVFGYSNDTDKLLYQRKLEGTWQAVREI
jgi:hypothetical protein